MSSRQWVQKQRKIFCQRSQERSEELSAMRCQESAASGGGCATAMQFYCLTIITIAIVETILIRTIVITIRGALKGANRQLYNLLTAPPTVSNTCLQVARAQSRANHEQHIERLSRATCRVQSGTRGQLSCLVWQS